MVNVEIPEESGLTTGKSAGPTQEAELEVPWTGQTSG